MKHIIKGKRYDTETATEVAKHWNGLSNSDFRHVREALYRTPRGNWFLEGTGGPLSSYARSNGNSTYGGSGVRVLSPGEAQDWLEAHEETEAIEEYFSTTLEDA